MPRPKGSKNHRPTGYLTTNKRVKTDSLCLSKQHHKNISKETRRRESKLYKKTYRRFN